MARRRQQSERVSIKEGLMGGRLMKKERCLLTMIAVIMLLVPSCEVANHPPLITSLKAESNAVYTSGSCQIECIATDEDGDELSYEWSASKGNIHGSGATVTWTAPESEGVYNVAVTVTDGRGGKVTDYVTVTVKVNSPPVINTLIADADWITPSGSLQVKCDAEDPDGDELSYEWSTSEGDISGTGPEVTWTAPEAVGTCTITVAVTDAHGEKYTRSVTIGVVPNTPPTIEDLIVTAAHMFFRKQSSSYLIGKATSCQIECLASAPKGSGLHYEWSASGGELSGGGSMVAWTAPNISGEFTVSVTVSDTT
ncbi:MAG: hypothetical protein COT13_04195, partial [Chloroflexi bacterium CG08_land_8_20_14_0_20_45_12]